MSEHVTPVLIGALKRILPVRILLIAVALVCAVGCTTAPITGRNQLIMSSEAQEAALGLSSFNEIKSQQQINADPAINELVQRVGKRIAAAASEDIPNAQWEFVVFDDPQPNAFCLPGGKVGIYTGILPITKNEAGLATVIGHEVAHAAARHGGERMTYANLIGIGQVGLGYATQNASSDTKLLWNSLYGVGTTVGGALPHSRLQESEADQMGLIYMARAGYDPKEAVAFWTRFANYNKQNGGADTVWFLRTHPLDDTRIRQIQGWIPEAELQYRPQP